MLTGVSLGVFAATRGLQPSYQGRCPIPSPEPTELRGTQADEDRRNGFERGGWARGQGATETDAFINRTYQRADAFLLGRRTYELFAGS